MVHVPIRLQTVEFVEFKKGRKHNLKRFRISIAKNEQVSSETNMTNIKALALKMGSERTRCNMLKKSILEKSVTKMER